MAGEGTAEGIDFDGMGNTLVKLRLCWSVIFLLEGIIMKKRNFVWLLILIIFVSGCATGNPPPISSGAVRSGQRGTQGEENLAAIAPESPVAVPVLMQGAGGVDGIYTGAWLGEHISKRDFILQVGRNHAMFVYEYTLGEDIPVTWILQAIAIMATPVFIISPPQDDGDSDFSYPGISYPGISMAMEYFARGVGAFNIPFFAALYPGDWGMSGNEFVLMYRYSRSIFMEYAPMATFVWVAPGDQACPGHPFFPGAESVDWVAVPLLAGRITDGFTNVLEGFERFYHHFGQDFPIMVLPVGVSHFSLYDHRYYIEEAGAELMEIYHALRAFPNVGAVIYGDAFGFARGLADDFAISIERELLAAYGAAIGSRCFVNKSRRGKIEDAGLVRSSYMGRVWQGELYVRVDTLAEFGQTIPRGAVEMDGNMYVKGAGAFCYDRLVIVLG